MRGRRPKPPSETSLHLSVAGYLRRAWPEELIWLHVPNGAFRNVREASKLKAMGVLPGAPDLMFVLPKAQVAWIELKTTAGALSEVQIEFRRKALALKCGYAVCRTPEEVEDVITRWLAAYGLKPRASMVQRPAAAAPLLEARA